MTKLLLVLALVAGSAAAQENAAKVTGKVVLEDGPLPGVTVVLENSAGRSIQLSDVEGRFAFSNVASGDYRITAELLGLKTRQTYLAVSAGDVTEIEVRMTVERPSPRICLDCDHGPLILPDGTFVITRDMLKNFPTN